MKYQTEQTKVDFYLGRELKSIGFDWKCDYLDGDRNFISYPGTGYSDWETYTPIPTQSMVIDWIRLRHNIHVDVGWTINPNDLPVVVKWWKIVTTIGVISNEDNFITYDSFESAQLAGITEAIKMIKLK